MQVSDVFSFADAAEVWVRDRDDRLSVSTERAYRGEIDRLAQFFAVKYGALALGDFTREHWEGYLDELHGVREHVVTCREQALSAASAAQAIRIGAAFLRWARDEGLLGWAPKGARTGRRKVQRSVLRQPLVDLSEAAPALHPALEILLTQAPEHDATQEALRAQLAVGLAYWGGLRTSDIAALRKRDIAVDGSAVEIRHPRFDMVDAIHGNVAATWRQYRAVREEAGSELTAASPVVAALGSDEPISAWSVWALIAQHIENITGVEKLYSAQSLRRARVAAMGWRCAEEVDELSRYARRVRVDFSTSAAATNG